MFKKLRIDSLGILASGLCALHCAALPLLLSLGLIGTFDNELHHTFEWTVIFFSFIFGGWSIYNALKSDGRIWPQVLIGAGVMIILIGFYAISNHYLMAVGGGMLLTGHWANWRQLGSSKS